MRSTHVLATCLTRLREFCGTGHEPRPLWKFNESRGAQVTGRRHFGSVRKRPSGRWQATYKHEGERHSAGTFSSKADALALLSTIEADLRRGAWIDPRTGQVTVGAYANEWLQRRPDLAVRTRELYRFILDKHIFPSLGQATLSGLAPSRSLVAC